MMQVFCKNCGAAFSGEKERCPYCGTMNRPAVRAGFRAKVADAINRILGLKDEAYQSLSKMIFMACLRALAIVAVIVLLAFACSQLMDTNYHDDYEYDLRALENIEWAEANLDALEEAFEAGDYKTIERLSYENHTVVSAWPHYPEFQLHKAYNDIVKTDRLGAYELQRVLYFLFKPGYYVERNRMASIEEGVYEGLRQDVLDRMQQAGYTEAQLQEIYDSCADSQGYLTASSLEDFVRGGDHG